MKNFERIDCGNNIFLSPLRSDDEAINCYMRWINENEILPWLGRNNQTITWEQEKEWAKGIQNNHYNHYFNIVERSNNKIIGNCEISIIKGTRNASLGILIGEKECRDKGYGTRVIKALIEFGFNQLNVHRIKLTANSDNIRAIKCYEKAGMIICGREHETQWYNGKWCDTIHMEILEQNFYKNN